MRLRRKNENLIFDPSGFGRFLIDPRQSYGHIKNLHHRRSHGTAVAAVTAAYVIGGDPSLTVGGSGHRDQRRFPRDPMAHLYGVADGINIFHGSFHPIIDQNAVFHSRFQSDLPRQRRIRSHTDGHHRHIGGHGFPITDHNPDLSPGFLEAFGHGIEQNTDLFLPQIMLKHGGHIPIQRRKKPIHRLNQRHFHTSTGQIFRHLKADKTTADDQRGFRLFLFNIRANRRRILNRTQGKQTAAVRAGQIAAHRFRPGGEEELIIGFRIDFSLFQITHRNIFSFGIHR